MNIERFRQNCSRASLEDLLTMRTNCEAKGATEFVLVAENELNRRFPGWDRTRSRGTPTRVRFGADEHLFQTAKEAYLWLIERFIGAYPAPFEKVDWSTRFVVEGRKRAYFAREPGGLFLASPDLADNPNNYEGLSNGWFAIVNLNNNEKFAILCRLAAVAKVEFEKQWYWEVV